MGVTPPWRRGAVTQGLITGGKGGWGSQMLLLVVSLPFKL